MPRHPHISKFTGTEKISLAEAKQYCRLDSSFTLDDAYITELIKIARLTVLKDTNQVVVKQTIEEWRDNYGRNNIIQLSFPGKISSLVIFARQDTTTEQTLVLNKHYILQLGTGISGQIEFIAPVSLFTNTNGIRLTYISEPADVDSVLPLNIAMYLLIQHWYDHRSPVKHLQTYETPISYQKLVNNYKQFV